MINRGVRWWVGMQNVGESVGGTVGLLMALASTDCTERQDCELRLHYNQWLHLATTKGKLLDQMV